MHFQIFKRQGSLWNQCLQPPWLVPRQAAWHDLQFSSQGRTEMQIQVLQNLGLPLFSTRANPLHLPALRHWMKVWGWKRKERGKMESERGNKGILPRIQHYADIETFLGPKSWSRTHSWRCPAPLLFSTRSALLEGPKSSTGLSWPSLNIPIHIRIITHRTLILTPAWLFQPCFNSVVKPHNKPWILYLRYSFFHFLKYPFFHF